MAAITIGESPAVPAGSVAGTYDIDLAVKDLVQAGTTYRYFDYARAVRK